MTTSSWQPYASGCERRVHPQALATSGWWVGRAAFAVRHADQSSLTRRKLQLAINLLSDTKATSEPQPCDDLLCDDAHSDATAKDPEGGVTATGCQRALSTPSPAVPVACMSTTTPADICNPACPLVDQGGRAAGCLLSNAANTSTAPAFESSSETVVYTPVGANLDKAQKAKCRKGHLGR